MPVVHRTQTRRHETPNATMTTLASPTVGETAQLSLWRVDMVAGARGPEHTFDVEQVWTAVRGGAQVTVGGTAATVAAGDTLVLPAGTLRQIVADDSGFEALVAAPAGARASMPDGTDRGVPPWIA